MAGVLDRLDAGAVRRWARDALDRLGSHREEIDGLNVYPVPDGDTGTNLYLTVESAVAAVDQVPTATTCRVWRTPSPPARCTARGAARA